MRPLHDGSEQSTGSMCAAAMAEPSFGLCGKGARGHGRTGEKGEMTAGLTEIRTAVVELEEALDDADQRAKSGGRCGGDELGGVVTGSPVM